MDYKELHQQVYDELKDRLGHEPEWHETWKAYQDAIGNMIDNAREIAKYE